MQTPQNKELSTALAGVFVTPSVDQGQGHGSGSGLQPADDARERGSDGPDRHIHISVIGALVVYCCQLPTSSICAMHAWFLSVDRVKLSMKVGFTAHAQPYCRVDVSKCTHLTQRNYRLVLRMRRPPVDEEKPNVVQMRYFCVRLTRGCLLFCLPMSVYESRYA